MRRACRIALQLRLSSVCSSSVAGPSRSIGGQEHRRSKVSISMSEKDEKLIQRGEFFGFAASNGRREYAVNSPEDALSHLNDHMSRKYRVNPEYVMIDLVLRLENGDAALISLLQGAPEKWIPTSIRLCGRALSSIQIESRREIASRLWEQIEQRDLPISIESINAILRVKLENNEQWDAWETLKEIEEKRGLVPDQETFHLLLEKISLTGDANDCSKLSYEMARRGHSPSDAISHSHLVYASAVRGHDQKADSMIQQAATKFGSEGEALSLGTACVAAAAGGRIDRLREVLRRSVDDDLRLRLPIESVFEIIWKLSEQKGDNEMNNEVVIEEILDRSPHPTGFFRLLYREIERHISASHFRTSMVLLAETMRVKEAFKEKGKNYFSEQLVGVMCRAMVKSRIDKGLMLDMANRMETRLDLPSHFIHKELMLSALTLKDFDPDERFSVFSSLLPVVDPNKERPHLILPLLAVTPSVDDRLKLIFRASSLGYSNLGILDTNLMANYLFQPMYNRHSFFARKRKERNSVMERVTTILQSYGVSKESVWQMMNGWWKTRKEEKVSMGSVKPIADEIQTWLRAEYSSTFDRAKEEIPTLPLNKTRLDNAIEKGDTSTVISLLSTHGWPANDIDLSETAPRILELLLENESSVNIMKWLYALSREAACRQEREEEVMKSPLDSSHILRIIRHRLSETRLPTKALIEMAYELKRLFPNAVYNQDSYLDTIPETNRLISACFTFKEGKDLLTIEAVDNITELLRTLIKLEIVYLTVYEVVTPFCVHRVLQRFGWDSAVKLWLRFQSSLSFGNGLAILLSHARRPDNVNCKEDVQFLMSKAQSSCLSPSRIHAIYAAVLVNTGSQFRPGRLENEAVEYFKKHGSEMSPFDCALAYRLINGVKYPPTEQYFIRTFPSLCLVHTPLAEKKEGEARNMLHSALAFCEAKRSGPLIVEMCNIFAQHGIESEEKEKRRIERTMEKHQEMVNRWIFSPEGLIQARVEDEFIKEDEWRKFIKVKEPVEDNTVVVR